MPPVIAQNLVPIIIGLVALTAIIAFIVFRPRKSVIAPLMRTIWLRTKDGRHINGKLLNGRIESEGQTVDFSSVREIQLEPQGLCIKLRATFLQFQPAKVEGEVSIAQTGASEPTEIPLADIQSLRQYGI